jgi:hypothetical protein
MKEIESILERAQTHQHRLTGIDAAQTAVHGGGPIARVNKWLAVRITEGVGTMWCAYAFALLAIVSLPAAIVSHSAVIIVQWISQTFLQLVLLSIIIVGQNVLAEASDQRAQADHETLELLRQVNLTQLEILQELHSLAVVEPARGTPAAPEAAAGSVG